MFQCQGDKSKLCRWRVSFIKKYSIKMNELNLIVFKFVFRFANIKKYLHRHCFFLFVQPAVFNFWFEKLLFIVDWRWRRQWQHDYLWIFYSPRSTYFNKCCRFIKGNNYHMKQISFYFIYGNQFQTSEIFIITLVW
jgi:hypothetical protein